VRQGIPHLTAAKERNGGVLLVYQSHQSQILFFIYQLLPLIPRQILTGAVQPDQFTWALPADLLDSGLIKAPFSLRLIASDRFF